MADEEGRPGFKDIVGQLKKNPLLLGVIVVGIIGVLYILYKQKQQIAASSTASPTTPSTPSATTQGAGGSPSGLQLSQFFYGANTTQGEGSQAPAASQPSGGTNIPQQLQPSTNATTMTGGSTDQFHSGIIRNRYSNSQVSSYDASSTGVPIWSSPGATPGTQIGTIDFGTSIQEQGPAVSGGSNFGLNSTGGSNLWYKVTSGSKTGYVSAFDIQGG